MQNVDFYPYSPTLQVNSSDGYKTRVGGVITMMIALGILLSAIAFCRELFEKSNPFVLSSINFDQGPTLKKDSISLFVAPLLPGGLIIPEVETYFKFTVEMSNTDAGNSTRPGNIMSYFELQRCPQTVMYANKDMYAPYLFQSFDYYYCLDPGSEDRLLDLYGSYGNLKFILWNLVLSPCVNTTENNNSCKSIEQIRDKLPLFYVHLEITNMLVDSFDLLNPLKPIFTSHLMRASSFNSRDEIIYFTTIFYNTDMGFILEDKSEIKGFEISRTETDSLYVDAENLKDSYMVKIKITLLNQKLIYVRGYIKIQTIAANIGGLAKFLILVLGYLNSKYNNVFFLRYIYMKSLKHQTKTEPSIAEKSELHRIDMPKTNTNILRDSSTLPHLVPGYFNSEKPSNLLNNYILRDSLVDKLSFCEIIKYMIGINRLKPTVLQKVSSCFNYYFTVEGLLKVLMKELSSNPKINNQT